MTPSQGLVQGPGAATLGFAAADLPNGSVISGFHACGRDFGNPDQFIARLKRKSIVPCTTAGCTFTAPDLLAQVASGALFAQDALICLATNTISFAKVDTTNFSYYVEIELDGPVQMLSVQVDHQ